MREGPYFDQVRGVSGLPRRQIVGTLGARYPNT